MTLKPDYEDRRTLVVDDHEISGRHAVAALSQHAGTVHWAKTACEALKLALSWYPHTIFLDLLLPDKNGVEVIRLIRADWPGSQPPAKIVVLTADESGLAHESLAGLSIDRVLVKPVTGVQLREVAGFADAREVSESIGLSETRGLPALFRQELRQQLPLLDSSLSSLDRGRTAWILHQLIASAAMCTENRLESALRTMDRLCLQQAAAGEIAVAYHALLESAREFISREH